MARPPLNWLHSSEVGTVVHHHSRDPFDLLAARDVVRARLEATERLDIDAGSRLHESRQELADMEAAQRETQGVRVALIHKVKTAEERSALRGFEQTLAMQRRTIERMRVSVAIEGEQRQRLADQARELRQAAEGLRELVHRYVSPPQLRQHQQQSQPELFAEEARHDSEAESLR